MKLCNREQHLLRVIEGVAETLLLAALYYFAWNKYNMEIGEIFLYRGKFLLMGIYCIITYLVFRACDSYNIGNLKGADIAVSQFIATVLVNTITYFQICLIANRMVRVAPMIWLQAADLAVVLICSYLFTWIYHRTYTLRDAIMVYGNPNALGLVEKFGKRMDEYRISEIVSADEGEAAIFEKIGRHDMVILNDMPFEIRNHIVKYCFEKNIHTLMVPRITDVLVRGAEDITLFDTPMDQINGGGLNIEEAFFKRALDILVSAVLAVPVLLLILVTGIFIKLEDGGSIFYRQERLTLNGKVFNILKLRTMVENAEKDTGAVLAGENDHRITKVGKFLRKHRLDEIPQILNVLAGSLSLVGPRPERPELAAKIEKEMPEFAYRTRVKGGITGYAQVYGKYNTTAYDKLKMDLIYIENYSLLLDIKLLLMTPQILFRKDSTEGIRK